VPIEAVATENQGYFIKLLDELVYRHGVMFVTSAGNNGPCLSTVGAPGGTSDSVISVGAMVTQSLMKTSYPMIGVNKETNFTWSSVGPSIEGARGVCVVAPGGAITSVPSWTLNRNQLMNGTSMSSPNCCGCISLLLSALLQSNIPYSPHSVRRAVEHSARLMADMDTVGQGFGMIQVEAAWEALQKIHGTGSARPDGVVPYRIDVWSERFSRGIYLRQAYETSIKNTYKVDIAPLFIKPLTPDSVDDDLKMFHQQQTEYEYRVRLVSSQPWITCPDRVLMVQAGKVVPITIDPRQLERETVFSEYVRGYLDTGCDDSPADTTQPFLFEVPITVIRPKVIPPNTSQLVLKNLCFSDSTQRHRRFLVPPPGCQFIDCVITDTRRCNTNAGSAPGDGDDLEGTFPSAESDVDCETSTYLSDVSTSVSNDDDGTTRMLMIHAMQIFNGTPYRDHEKRSYLQLRPGQTQVITFSVTSDVILELCTGLFWSTRGSVNCNITLQFRGVEVSPCPIVIGAGCRVCPEKIRICSNLVPEMDITPSGSLDKWHCVIQPSNTGVVRPLLGDIRDAVWGDSGTILYHMTLEYTFEHVEGSGNDVIPRFSGLQGMLYEAPHHAQFIKVYDISDSAGTSGPALVGVGDAFPDKITLSPKSKYILRLQLRHNEAALLESLADVPLVLERSLKSTIPLACFKTQAEALVGTKGKNATRGIVCGGSISYFMREPAMDALPKGAAAGDMLTGSMVFIKKNETGRLGAQDRPKGYPVKYICGPTKAPPAAAAATAPASVSMKVDSDTSVEAPASDIAADLQKSVDSALKEAKFKLLKGMVGGKDELFSELHRKLIEEFPTELAPHVSGMRHAESRTKDFYRYNCVSYLDSDAAVAVTAIDRVVDNANKVIGLIDTTALAGTLGVNADKDDAKAVAAKKEADGKKTTLVEALIARSLAVLNKANFLDPTAAKANYDLLDGAYHQELSKWESVSTASACWRLVVEKHKRAGRWGCALKRVCDMLGDGSAGGSGKSKNTKSGGGDSNELTEEKLFLLGKLGWTHILEFVRRCNLLNKHSTTAFRELNSLNNKSNGSF